MRLAAFLVAVIATTMTLAPARAAATTPAPTVMPDCTGKPVVKPGEYMLACGDGAFYANKLHWTGWGQSFTAARGIGWLNDCTPTCAAGHFHSYNIVLLADGTQRCPHGRLAYARITWAWIGRGPHGAGSDSSQQLSRCEVLTTP